MTDWENARETKNKIGSLNKKHRKNENFSKG